NKIEKDNHKQEEEIVQLKLADLNTRSMEAAKKNVMGSARRMGVEVVE
ncbi:50S ribosomal protein L11, partial [Helicobacter pylori]